jgi:hypothetical protein
MQNRPRPTLPIELLRMLEVAFTHANIDEAYSIVRRAFDDFKPEQVSWSSSVADIFTPRQAAILNRAGILQLKDFFGTTTEGLLSQRQIGRKLVQSIIRELHLTVRTHRLTLPPNCFGEGPCDLFKDFERDLDQ